jgi:outer membrane protein assembly factor BamD (BamD/ComL family)
MILRRGLLVLLAFAALIAEGAVENCLRGADTGAPQSDDRPLDARTYSQGLDALRAGRRDEAARLLRKVFGDFPESPSAPPAILKVAEMIYPASSWSQIGSATPAVIKEAGDLLASLAQKYRSSREAPRALVRLGYLALEPANPKGDLEEACGRFATAAQVYPDSDAADDAYFGSGMCEALRARPARAADVFSRLLEEQPASPLAAEALYRFGVALSHLDDAAEAVLALQRVRTTYPDSPFAARALERITLLRRLRLGAALRTGPGAGSAGAGSAAAEIYRFDAEYGAAAPAARAETVARSDGGAQAGRADLPASIRGASDIAIDAQGLAVVASPKTPGVFRLDARGRIQERIAHPGPDFVAVGDGLAVYISGRDQIALNARNWSGPDFQGLDGRPPRDFGPIAVGPLGRVYLLDRTLNALLIYDRGHRLATTVQPANQKEGRFVDVAMGEDGAVFVLDGRAKSVAEIHQTKESTRVSLAALGLQEMVALAADGLGDLYVLDGRSGEVTVADPLGHRIAVIRPGRDAQSRLGEASAVAVDAIGRVYLCGRKSGQVVRFQ